MGLKLLKIQLRVARFRRSHSHVSDLFTQVAQQHPNKTALVSVLDGRQLTFQELEEMSNQVIGETLSSLLPVNT